MKSIRSSLAFRFVAVIVLVVLGRSIFPFAASAIGQVTPINLKPCTGDALNEANECVKAKRCAFKKRCGSYVLPSGNSSACNGPDPSDGDNCIVDTDDPKVECAIRGKCKLDADGKSCVPDTTKKIWTDNAYDDGDCSVPNTP
jgi:hypothetical protein